MKGHGYLVRYCDDFVTLVQYKDDAEMIHRELKQRLGDNGLATNEDKTRVIGFGRFEKINAQSVNESQIRLIFWVHALYRGKSAGKIQGRTEDQ